MPPRPGRAQRDHDRAFGFGYPISHKAARLVGPSSTCTPDSRQRRNGFAGALARGVLVKHRRHAPHGCDDRGERGHDESAQRDHAGCPNIIEQAAGHGCECEQCAADDRAGRVGNRRARRFCALNCLLLASRLARLTLDLVREALRCDGHIDEVVFVRKPECR
jgi:hypothetical protein